MCFCIFVLPKPKQSALSYERLGSHSLKLIACHPPAPANISIICNSHLKKTQNKPKNHVSNCFSQAAQSG